MIGILSILLGVGICLLMLCVTGGLVVLTLKPSSEPTHAPPATAVAAWTAIITATPHLQVDASQVGVPQMDAPEMTIPGTTKTVTTAPTLEPEPTNLPPDRTPEAAPTANSAPEQQQNGDCPHPDGWNLHQVQPGETLFAYVLGTGGTITTDEIRQGNCLSSDLLQVGQPLYLPAGAAANAPSSEPAPLPGTVATGPRTPECNPHCTISIRPGWRAEQIAQAIDTTPVGFWGSNFLVAIGPDSPGAGYDFLASKPPGQSFEGFLYPGTYELSNDSTALDFRNMLLAAFATQYTPDMTAAASAHGQTFYEALTLASIIQRESWAYSEQVLISSVFHNRLRSGAKLGTTVTTQYYYGGPGNWWPRISGSQINTNNPYNTNINAGLPPSPISSPASDALRAALTPADTDYLYFTGNCRGSGNVYAATFAEHEANVACR
ncbi:endolytic transglycosylase MltG [Chloroflexota bacterium]